MKSLSIATLCLLVVCSVSAFSHERPTSSRRDFLLTPAAVAATVSVSQLPLPANAAAAAVQDSLNVDQFLRTGVDLGGNMGVSSQAGKSRPQTGVVFRDGSQVLQDKQGAVSAEILTGTRADPQAILVSFVCPWKLETGPVFDVECRDAKTGDGAFLAVTKSTNGKSLQALPASFFLDRLFDPTGRFSFYGPPTDVKVKSDTVQGNSRYLAVNFSNLSQSTNAEIPRKALLVATLPQGSDNAVMLVASANASRWKSQEQVCRNTVESFRAVAAPKTGMKVRPKERGVQDFF